MSKPGFHLEDYFSKDKVRLYTIRVKKDMFKWEYVTSAGTTQKAKPIGFTTRVAAMKAYDKYCAKWEAKQ